MTMKRHHFLSYGLQFKSSQPSSSPACSIASMWDPISGSQFSFPACSCYCTPTYLCFVFSECALCCALTSYYHTRAQLATFFRKKYWREKSRPRVTLMLSAWQHALSAESAVTALLRTTQEKFSEWRMLFWHHFSTHVNPICPCSNISSAWKMGCQMLKG